MQPWWLRWQMKRCGVSLGIKIPFGGVIRSFSSFSDFWSVRQMVPSIGESRLIERAVRPSSINFDVGANVGAFTLAIAKACSTADVYSFEPAPTTFERLRRNVEANHAANVHLRRTAMGSQLGRALFQVDPGSPATNRFKTPDAPSHQCLEVDVQTIDATLHQAEDRHLGLLKIDVEGFECDVLVGATDSIRKNRWAAVLIEICPSNLYRIGRSITDLVAVCTSLGCSLFELTVDGQKGRELTVNELESIVLTNALVSKADVTG